MTRVRATFRRYVIDANRDPSEASGYSTVVNGRFKGGWTARHYGQPVKGVNTIQMELAQCTYLKSETAPFDYDPEKADCLRISLRAVLKALTGQALSLTTLS
jgi:formiminoglutamase